jgi:GTP cyclohydrolase I
MKETEDARQIAIEDAVKKILRAMDIDLHADPYRDTPRRVARMILELMSGMDEKNEPKLTLFKNEGYRDILMLKKIPFYSLCAHHMLPMFGHVSVAYIPGAKIVGLSKIPRIVKYFASRLQLQEDFTRELADFLYKKLSAMGVLVLVEARHLCLEMRGAKTHDIETFSSAVRGIFETRTSTKDEALRLLTSPE